MSISQTNQRILCAKSGNRCAMPDCRRILVLEKSKSDSAKLLAEMAHIKGDNPGSARYDSGMSNEERNSWENLILLCPSCHAKIDAQVSTYSVDKLVEIKRKHEQWIIDSTGRGLFNVTFRELQAVTSYLLAIVPDPTMSLSVIPPSEKIKKNGLSGTSATMITMGMTQVTQVENFITTSLDLEFGDRLKKGFIDEYQKLKREQLQGDALFNAMLDFSSHGMTDFNQRAAGLAVLVYLFEKCEVFEK